MSFILDALKKSEAERQQQAGPTLLELRVTAPRRRYPLWAVALGVLLVLNVLVLLVFLVRRPALPGAAVADVPPANRSLVPSAPVAPAIAAAPPLASSPALVNTPTVAPLPAAAAQAAVAPVTAPPVLASASPAPAAAPAAGIAIGPGSANPADQEPALPAATNYGALPSLNELSGDLPSLQLDLLDYSDRATERYALINMHRVHEGDTLPEGATVLAITREGVALDYRGQNFMLRPGGIR